jgi:hypothetical protein
MDNTISTTLIQEILGSTNYAILHSVLYAWKDV